MKRKTILLLSAAVIFLAVFTAWYDVPIDLMNLDHNEILEIMIFNGNTGNTTHIREKQQIQHMIENLNDFQLKRGKPSAGYSGYDFKITIYLSDGNEAENWNNFIVNSKAIIRKDPFFYTVMKEKIDYDYIESIAEQRN